MRMAAFLTWLAGGVLLSSIQGSALSLPGVGSQAQGATLPPVRRNCPAN
jgi:hypothetical protein